LRPSRFAFLIGRWTLIVECLPLAASLQRFNPSTLHPFNPLTLQRSPLFASFIRRSALDVRCSAFLFPFFNFVTVLTLLPSWRFRRPWSSITSSFSPPSRHQR